MNTYKINFDYEYITKLVTLSWSEILFGINNKFLSADFAIKHAVIDIIENNSQCEDVFQIAQLFKGESIHPFIDNLASRETKEESEIKSKFLYVLMSWFYENHNKYCNWNEMIDIIYSDFDYPKEMYSLVFYVPNDESRSVPPGEQYTMSRWREFLQAQSNKFRK